MNLGWIKVFGIGWLGFCVFFFFFKNVLLNLACFASFFCTLPVHPWNPEAF